MQRNTHAKIVLVGKTGQGKSYLGNKISGKDLFESSPHMRAATFEVKVGHFRWNSEDFAIPVSVIDTPGLADNRKDLNLTDKDILENVKKMMAEVKDGLNICLFCWETKTRFDKHDLRELKMVMKMLGEGVFHQLWICVTKLDERTDEYIKGCQRTVQEELTPLLKENKIETKEDQFIFSNCKTPKTFEESVKVPLEKILKKNAVYVPPTRNELLFYEYYVGQLECLQEEEQYLVRQQDPKDPDPELDEDIKYIRSRIKYCQEEIEEIKSRV